MLNNEESQTDSTGDLVVYDSGTVVIPAGVDEIVEDAFADCGKLERLYIKEGVDIDCLPGRVAWDCVKIPQTQSNDFFESEETWDFVTNGFFSGTEVQQPEFTFKKRDDECVRWMELRPREFQYICSLAFELSRDECDEVVGRWLFTRSLKSGKLLLQLASAFVEGREVEQDIPMALRCCEQACWCAAGDGISFTAGDVFPGIEVAAVDQFGDREICPELVDLYERANRLKEEVLTHFQRIDIRMFERVGEGNDIRCYRLRDHAFEGQDDLRNVLLPDELRDKQVRIGRSAFARCPNLRSITVAGMADGFAISRHANSFEDCDSLSDRIWYSADGSKLLFCLNASEECVVCYHVQAIADFAFMHSKRLRYFEWRCYDDGGGRWNAARSVGMGAFEGCGELCRVSTEGREISLDSRAFADCRMLCEYWFGNQGCTEVGVPIAFLDISAKGVFEGCEMMLHIWSTERDRGYLVVHDGSAGAQFSRCKELCDCPPIITTHIPPLMFDSCNMMSEVKCIGAHPDVIKAVISGRSPIPNLSEAGFSISTRAFAHCHSLEQFKFCRLRISLRRGAEAEVQLIYDDPKQVLFEHEAFLDCGNLNRHESSFSGASVGSDPTAFSGSPGFEGFVE